jgi:hypothetical protein
MVAQQPGSGIVDGTGPYIPELPADAGNLAAALAYAAAGLYLLPVVRKDRGGGDGKNPGSRVGKCWHDKSRRDPEMLGLWFSARDDGIALDLGHCGLVVLDVDKPELLEDWLSDILKDAGVPYQSTRPDTPRRGHYIFRQPEGRRIGCSKGDLNGMGLDVRGDGGVIIAQPTQHPEGGEYRWKRTGAIPVLPDAIAAKLKDTGDHESAATDAEVAAFIAEHTQARAPGRMKGWISAWNSALRQQDSRHDTMVQIAPWAMEEVRRGWYSAAVTVAVLRSMFVAAKTREYNGKAGLTDAGANAEFDSLLAWAIAQASKHTIQQLRERRRRGTATEFGYWKEARR